MAMRVTGFLMKNCPEVIREGLAAQPDLAILILSPVFPESFAAHPGPVTFIGDTPPPDAVASTEFVFRAAGDQAELLRELELLRGTRDRTGNPAVFDAIFIDQDHSFAALVDQIDRAIALSHDKTVFLFDDAAPPEIGMAGPAPTEGWWVGEVWMLAAALQGTEPGFRAWLIDLPPTGLLAATGIGPVPPADAADDYRRLSQARTIGEVRAVLDPLVDQSVSGLLAEALARCAGRSFLTVSPSSSSVGAERSVVLDAGGPWERPALAFLLDLSEQGLDVARLNQRNRYRHGVVLDTFQDATLAGLDTFISGGNFYSRSVEDNESVARFHIEIAHYSRTILQLRGDDIVAPRAALAAAIPIGGNVFFGTPDEPDNWGMWLLFGVPSAVRFLRDRQSYDGYLAYLGHSWQRRLLNHLGVGDDDLIEHQLENTWRCARMTLIRHDFRDLTVSASDRAIFLGLSEAFEREASGSYGEKIFISRRDISRLSDGYRALMSEDALCDALALRGFTIVEPERLPFPEQVRAFAGARVIVGLGGAGMFNVVFAKPGTRVVTIESSTDFVDGHVNLITSCDLACGVILGQKDLSDPEPVHKRWSLPVDAAVRQIDQFIG
jgi:hypothetical protein